MARYLFIVSRSESVLHAYLKERFARDEKVEVILDRRRGQRRLSGAAAAIERRRGDRRSRPEVDEELPLKSHVIVTIP